MSAIDEDAIVRECSSESHILLSHPHVAVKVIRMNDFAVKFGASVRDCEASRQQEVRERLQLEDDQADEVRPTHNIYVPRVHHFFKRDRIGYLVQEYIEECQKSTFDDEDVATITKCVAFLHTLEENEPRPLGHGPAEGLLWPDDHMPRLTNRAELAEFVRERAGPKRVPVRIEPPFALCHLDIALRNIIFMADGRIAIIDWASAGYYPRIFEIAAFHENNGAGAEEAAFCKRIAERLLEQYHFAQEELSEAQSLLTMAFNNVAHP